jgi:gluconolactonase
MVVPSIQRIGPEGSPTEVVATELEGVKLNGPNDLVFGPDGSLYFTDPGTYRPDDPEPSYLFVLHPDGTGKLLLEFDPPTFPNGIAFDGTGRLVWTESYTGMVRRMDLGLGKVEDIGRLPGERPVADGLAVAADGRLFVTSVNGAGIDVMLEDGEIVESIPVCPNPTNCVFTGDTLYVTAANALADTTEPSFTGSIWSVEAGVVGVPTCRGSIS